MADVGGSLSLKDLRAKRIAAAEAQATERRQTSSPASSTSTRSLTSPSYLNPNLRPVIDASIIRDKENRARKYREKQQHDRLTKIQQMREKDDQRRLAVEEKKRRQMAEEMVRREAMVKRTDEQARKALETKQSASNLRRAGSENLRGMRSVSHDGLRRSNPVRLSNSSGNVSSRQGGDNDENMELENEPLKPKRFHASATALAARYRNIQASEAVTAWRRSRSACDVTNPYTSTTVTTSPRLRPPSPGQGKTNLSGNLTGRSLTPVTRTVSSPLRSGGDHQHVKFTPPPTDDPGLDTDLELTPRGRSTAKKSPQLKRPPSPRTKYQSLSPTKRNSSPSKRGSSPHYQAGSPRRSNASAGCGGYSSAHRQPSPNSTRVSLTQSLNRPSMPNSKRNPSPLKAMPKTKPSLTPTPSKMSGRKPFSSHSPTKPVVAVVPEVRGVKEVKEVSYVKQDDNLKDEISSTPPPDDEPPPDVPESKSDIISDTIPEISDPPLIKKSPSPPPSLSNSPCTSPTPPQSSSPSPDEPIPAPRSGATTEEQRASQALAEKRRQAREKVDRENRERRERLDREAEERALKAEEERIREEEENVRREEERRLADIEKEKRREEREKEMKMLEERQPNIDMEKQREEADKIEKERIERMRHDEEERLLRKKRLDAVLARTRKGNMGNKSEVSPPASSPTEINAPMSFNNIDTEDSITSHKSEEERDLQDEQEDLSHELDINNDILDNTAAHPQQEVNPPSADHDDSQSNVEIIELDPADDRSPALDGVELNNDSSVRDDEDLDVCNTDITLLDGAQVTTLGLDLQMNLAPSSGETSPVKMDISSPSSGQLSPSNNTDHHDNHEFEQIIDLNVADNAPCLTDNSNSTNHNGQDHHHNDLLNSNLITMTKTDTSPPDDESSPLNSHPIKAFEEKQLANQNAVLTNDL